MRLRKHFVGVGDIVSSGPWVEEFVEIALAWFSPTRSGFIRELTKVQRVSIEEEERDLIIFSVKFLPISFYENEAGPAVGLHQRPALGHHSGWLGWITYIVHEDSRELAIRLSRANKNGNPVDKRVENTFLHEDRRVIRPEQELQVLEGTKSKGLQV